MATDPSSSTENLTLRLLQEMRKEIREIRNEGREVRSLALSLSDQVRRVERRLNELPDTLRRC